MDYVEVPLYGKYSHLKCKLDKDWYQMICVDGGCHLTFRKDQGYIVINGTYDKEIYKTCKLKRSIGMIRLHSLIMNNIGYPYRTNLVVDHINGDKLDNRTINLRVTTQQNNVNNTNNKLQISNKTGIRLLSRRFRHNRESWITQLRENGKRLYHKETSNYEDAKAIAEFHNLIRDL